MWMKIATLAVGSALAAQALKAWRRRGAGHDPAHERHAVNRWEDDGGMVPSRQVAIAPAHDEAAAGGATNRVRRITLGDEPSMASASS
jgi:hypothetical protein